MKYGLGAGWTLAFGSGTAEDGAVPRDCMARDSSVSSAWRSTVSGLPGAEVATGVGAAGPVAAAADARRMVEITRGPVR